MRLHTPFAPAPPESPPNVRRPSCDFDVSAHGPEATDGDHQSRDRVLHGLLDVSVSGKDFLHMNRPVHIFTQDPGRFGVFKRGARPDDG